MAEKDYSEAAFLAFLRHSAVSGITKPATARARRVAADHLLAELKAPERLDLRLLDVDELCARFHKLEGSTIRPESLQVYNERLKSGLQDFIQWTDAPTEFVSVQGEMPEAQRVAAQDDPGQAQAREELALNPPRSPFDIFPVPIREETVVYLQNIPLDLTSREADKIAAVVKALALPEDED